MNETDLLRHIADRAPAAQLSGGWSLAVGPGDDCAVLKNADGSPLLVTVDQLVEGVHFVPGTELSLIARKAVARSVSDIAAMGGVPSWATATGLLPKGYEQGEELIDALNRWAEHWQCPLIGGDLAFHAEANHPLTLTVTVAGVMEPGHAPVRRSGSQAGDSVYLTGPIGGSFDPETGLGRHLTFSPRLEAGRWASAMDERGQPHAHAMIDLSDGLGRDASRVAKASGGVIEIEAQRIPLHENAGDWREAIAAGEDYELMMTVAPGTAIPAQLGLIGPIGVCRALNQDESPTCLILDSDGTRHNAAGFGWDHG
ncbi:MAG: thiamine-monophosphate kinase [Phycisphaerales bacterium]